MIYSRLLLYISLSGKKEGGEEAEWNIHFHRCAASSCYYPLDQKTTWKCYSYNGGAWCIYDYHHHAATILYKAPLLSQKHSIVEKNGREGKTSFHYYYTILLYYLLPVTTTTTSSGVVRWNIVVINTTQYNKKKEKEETTFCCVVVISYLHDE